MPGGSVFGMRPILFMLIVATLAVLLVRQVPWRALFVTTGLVMFAAAFGIHLFYPWRKGYESAWEAFHHGRGTGLWWWVWVYGSTALYGIGIELIIVGKSGI